MRRATTGQRLDNFMATQVKIGPDSCILSRRPEKECNVVLRERRVYVDERQIVAVRKKEEREREAGYI